MRDLSCFGFFFLCMVDYVLCVDFCLHLHGLVTCFRRLWVPGLQCSVEENREVREAELNNRRSISWCSCGVIG
jgi:hypothetical protein